MKKLISLILLVTICSVTLTGCGQKQAAAVTISLSYTDEYLLIGGQPDSYGEPIYGLADSKGKQLLPVEYREISVSENGLIFTNAVRKDKDSYQIFRLDGSQIGEAYSFIESISPGEDGIMFCRQASFIGMAPVPPYVAFIQNPDDTRSYWLLDENGERTEEEPYGDMELQEDGTVYKCRGNILYIQTPDGAVSEQGDEVIQSYFDGKYQVKIFYPSIHGRNLALVDRDERWIAPPEYSSIYVPFEDRYILCIGDRTFLGGEQAFLYDDTNKLLADNSNGFSFNVQTDGSYVGISYVGNPFDGYSEKPILDKDGNPEPQGMYFVDKNGKRLSERYTCIEYYEHGSALKAAAEQAGTSYILREIGGIQSIADAAASNEAFYLLLTTDGKTITMPVKDLLIK